MAVAGGKKKEKTKKNWLTLSFVTSKLNLFTGAEDATLNNTILSASKIEANSMIRVPLLRLFLSWKVESSSSSNVYPLSLLKEFLFATAKRDMSQENRIAQLKVVI